MSADLGILLLRVLFGAAVVLVIVGGGRYSLDHELGLALFSNTGVATVLIILAVVGAGVTLALRRQTGPQTSAS